MATFVRHGNGWREVRERDGRFSSFKTKVQRAWHFTVRWTMIAGVLAGVGYGSWIARGIADPIQAYEQVVKTVTVTTPAATSTAPVMDRIAMCESHNSQYCTAELVKLKMCHSYEVGQVLHRTNSDGTIDTGVDQINSIWGATAAKLGYNLDVEKDNRAFGDWIYKNKGTGDWAASQSCWKR